MGCFSSKLAAADLRREKLYRSVAGDCRNHVVSLTSSTYGVLKLDHDEKLEGEEQETVEESKRSSPPVIPKFQKRVSREEPDIINAWELMKDLDDDKPVYSPAAKKPVKPNAPSTDPAKQKKFGGKENLFRRGLERSDPDPSRLLKPFSSSENAQSVGPASTVRFKPTPFSLKFQVSGQDSGGFSRPRRISSPSPVFDPELLEKELCEEGEQIKKIVSSTPRNRKTTNSAPLLDTFEKNCPPGGENTVVLYTTTLRGIRKTFEDCNAVRAAIESRNVRIVERDISMDSGFREELRLLMGKREVRVPVLFVKGRSIGGADDVLRLEDEGKLELLLEGIPRAEAWWCEGCGGLRFVMCNGCRGSCKVLDEEKKKKMVKCGECNENGLIHCPLCC